MFECEYGYHFPSSPTPSMLSDLARLVQESATTTSVPRYGPRQMGYGINKLTIPNEDETQAKRIREMFPTTPAPIVEQMIRVYHGREGLIKAALIALGYKRSKEYSTKEVAAQSPIMFMMSKPSSKKLFEKLVSYFPDKDEVLIRELMYKYHEVEPDIISALVKSDNLETRSKIGAKTQTSRLDASDAKMKLRYLKSLFPNCDVAEMYHLLHCKELKVVIDIMEQRGHKKANIEEVLKDRSSQIQQVKAQQAAFAAKEKEQPSNVLETYKNRTKPVVTDARATAMKDILRKDFQDLSDDLLLVALQAADYNEELAKKFIEQMGPIDDKVYMKHFEFEQQVSPAVVLYPCKGVQKGEMNYTSTANCEFVAIPKEVVDCDHALALLKVDASTFTGDDSPVTRVSQARGKNEGLAKGPMSRGLQAERVKLVQGARDDMRQGSKYEQVCADRDQRKPNSLAKGSNYSLLSNRIRGSLRVGHNPNLILRTHPFFDDSKTFVRTDA